MNGASVNAGNYADLYCVHTLKVELWDVNKVLSAGKTAGMAAVEMCSGPVHTPAFGKRIMQPSRLSLLPFGR